MSIADIRQTYQKFELLESAAASDPYTQFDQWFQQALGSEVDRLGAIQTGPVLLGEMMIAGA